MTIKFEKIVSESVVENLLSFRRLLKTSAKQNRNEGCDSQLRPRLRSNSQPQGVTKVVFTYSFLAVLFLAS